MYLESFLRTLLSLVFYFPFLILYFANSVEAFPHFVRRIALLLLISKELCLAHGEMFVFREFLGKQKVRNIFIWIVTKR